MDRAREGQPRRRGISCRPGQCCFRSCNGRPAEVYLPSRPRSVLDRGKWGLAFFAYSADYLVDLDNAIVVDVEATTAIRQAEVTAAKRMIERTMDRFGHCERAGQRWFARPRGCLCASGDASGV